MDTLVSLLKRLRKEECALHESVESCESLVRGGRTRGKKLKAGLVTELSQVKDEIAKVEAKLPVKDALALDGYHWYVVDRLAKVWGTSKADVLRAIVRGWVADHTAMVEGVAGLEEWEDHLDNPLAVQHGVALRKVDD